MPKGRTRQDDGKEQGAEQVSAGLRERIASLEQDARLKEQQLQALRCEVLQHRLLFDAAKDGIVLAENGTGRVLQTNRAFLEMSGLDASSLIGAPLWEIGPLRDTDAGLVVVRELRSRDRLYYDDLPFLRRDGTQISVELTCTAQQVADGRIIHCTFRNIQARKSIEDGLWRAEARFRALFQHAHVGIAFIDTNGLITDNNRTLEEMLGYEANELRGTPCSNCVHPDDQAAESPLFQELREGSRTSYHLTLRHRRKEGDELWALVGVTAIAGAGGGDPIVIRIVEDITDRKRAEETVIRSRDFYRALLNELPNPIRLANREGKGDYFNRAWRSFTGRRREHNIGDGWTASVHPADRERVVATLQDALRERRVYQMEYRLQHTDDSHHWVVEFGNPFNDLSGAFAGYVSSCYDIHERKKLQETLESISITDDLTGLLNRRGFFTLAQQQVKLSNRSGRSLILLYADLDGLKAINDTHGHRMGDEALIETAAILRDVFRESDIIARLGGDEFAVLMVEDAGMAGERSVAGRLQQAIDERNRASQAPYDLAISAGITRYDPAQVLSLDRILSEADRMMYEVKKTRKNS